MILPFAASRSISRARSEAMSNRTSRSALSPNASYLAKPFTPRALALAVRALLDEPQDGSSAV